MGPIAEAATSASPKSPSEGSPRRTRRAQFVRSTALLIVAGACVLAGTACGSSDGPSSTSPSTPPATAEGAAAVELIEASIDAFERRDIAAFESFLADDVTLTQPMTLSGSPEPDTDLSGKEPVLGYFSSVFSLMDQIRFTDRRFTGAPDGSRVVLEADGDFTLPDGRPYRNQYVLSFDLQDGEIIAIREYANPVTFSVTFGGLPLGPTTTTTAGA